MLYVLRETAPPHELVGAVNIRTGHAPMAEGIEALPVLFADADPTEIPSELLEEIPVLSPGLKLFEASAGDQWWDIILLPRTKEAGVHWPTAPRGVRRVRWFGASSVESALAQFIGAAYEKD
jgi:hypothetical protein